MGTAASLTSSCRSLGARGEQVTCRERPGPCQPPGTETTASWAFPRSSKGLGPLSTELKNLASSNLQEPSRSTSA